MNCIVLSMPLAFSCYFVHIVSSCGNRLQKSNRCLCCGSIKSFSTDFLLKEFKKEFKRDHINFIRFIEFYLIRNQKILDRFTFESKTFLAPWTHVVKYRVVRKYWTRFMFEKKKNRTKWSIHMFIVLLGRQFKMFGKELYTLRRTSLVIFMYSFPGGLICSGQYYDRFT